MSRSGRSPGSRKLLGLRAVVGRTLGDRAPGGGEARRNPADLLGVHRTQPLTGLDVRSCTPVHDLLERRGTARAPSAPLHRTPSVGSGSNVTPPWSMPHRGSLHQTATAVQRLRACGRGLRGFCLLGIGDSGGVDPQPRTRARRGSGPRGHRHCLCLRKRSTPAHWVMARLRSACTWEHVQPVGPLPRYVVVAVRCHFGMSPRLFAPLSERTTHTDYVGQVELDPWGRVAARSTSRKATTTRPIELVREEHQEPACGGRAAPRAARSGAACGLRPPRATPVPACVCAASACGPHGARSGDEKRL
jgi:hypothetical protein